MCLCRLVSIDRYRGSSPAAQNDWKRFFAAGGGTGRSLTGVSIYGIITKCHSMCMANETKGEVGHMQRWKNILFILVLGGILLSCRDVIVPVVPTPTSQEISHSIETPLPIPLETTPQTLETTDSDEGIQFDNLFTEAAPIAGMDISDDPNILRTRFVRVNFDLLTVPEEPTESQPEGEVLELNLFDDVILKVIVDRVTSDPLGNITWTGHLEGESPSRVSLSIAGETMSGEIETQGFFYRVEHVENGIHVIYEYEQSTSSSGEGPPGLDSTPHVSPQVPVTVTHVEARTLETAPDQVELII